jgi:hypothetical protein
VQLRQAAQVKQCFGPIMRSGLTGAAGASPCQHRKGFHLFFFLLFSSQLTCVGPLITAFLITKRPAQFKISGIFCTALPGRLYEIAAKSNFIGFRGGCIFLGAPALRAVFFPLVAHLAMALPLGDVRRTSTLTLSTPHICCFAH